MAMTLEQYASYLDSRALSWPAPPDVERPKVKPHLERLPQVRAVIWNVYGTLLNIFSGELLLEHPQKLMMDLALDKTLQEFKMWGSMTRKPGQPAEYLGQLYQRALGGLKNLPSPGEKYPEIQVEKIWEDILKKLLQKDYKFDVGFYGSLNEYSRKVAYFFHASLQGVACYDGAAEALLYLRDLGMPQGLFGHGQVFTKLQLQRCLLAQQPEAVLAEIVDPEAIVFSAEQRARKPSERLYRYLLSLLQRSGLSSHEILLIGADVPLDIIPARKLGLKTALFAGDKGSLRASAEQLKDPSSRPDVLLSELPQIMEVVPG